MLKSGIMPRRMFVFAAAVVLGVMGGTARAATEAPFEQKAFEAAQAANKPIIIAVHADWCPTCKVQKPIMDSLAKEPEYKDLVILVVDFDKDKDVLKALQVQKQSTLIAMRGKVEKDRSAGVTAEADIKALFQKAAG